MARSHRMTPKRRAALRKAQAVSARKRKGKGKGKLAAANRSNNRLRTGLKTVGTAAAIGAVAYGAHHFHGVLKRHQSNRVRSAARARIQGKRTHRSMVHAANQMAAAHAAHRRRESEIWAAAKHALTRPNTRRENARIKLAKAAQGTSGHHERTFSGGGPKKPLALPRGRGLNFTVSKPKSKRARNRANRMSVHESVMGTPTGYTSGRPFKVSSTGRVSRTRRRRRK